MTQLNDDCKINFSQKMMRASILETFVDQKKFRGHCYRAANWTRVGQTTGRGKYDRKNQGLSSIKDVWIYPLLKKATHLLCQPQI